MYNFTNDEAIMLIRNKNVNLRPQLITEKHFHFQELVDIYLHSIHINKRVSLNGVVFGGRCGNHFSRLLTSHKLYFMESNETFQKYSVSARMRFISEDPFKETIMKKLPYQIDIMFILDAKLNKSDIDGLKKYYFPRFNSKSVIFFTGSIEDKELLIKELNEDFDAVNETNKFFKEHKEYMKNISKYNFKEHNFTIFTKSKRIDKKDITNDVKEIKDIEEHLDEGNPLTITTEVIKSATKKDLELIFKNLGYEEKFDKSMSKNKLQNLIIKLANIQS